MTRKINIIGCGGFGTNISAALLTREVYKKAKDHINMLALDTSESNLRRFEGTEFGKLVDKYLVPGADGSGKVRGTNIAEITGLVTDVVNKGIEPGLTILVYSASGGSGAVIGPELHEALAKRGYSVISMVLETDASIQDVSNTAKTLKTMQYKASLGDKQFNTFWEANRRPETGQINMAAADRQFLLTIEDFIALGHPGNEEIDSKDIDTFLNFSLTPTDKPVVRFITCVARSKPEEEFVAGAQGAVPVTAMSVLTARDVNPSVVSGTGAHFQGYLTPELSFEGVIEVQYQIFGGLSAKKVAELSTAQTNFENIAKKAAESSAGDVLVKAKNDEVSEGGTFL